MLLVASQQGHPRPPVLGPVWLWCWEPYSHGAGNCTVAISCQTRGVLLSAPADAIELHWLMGSQEMLIFSASSIPSKPQGGRGTERGPGSTHPVPPTSLGADILLPEPQKPGKCLNFPGWADYRAEPCQPSAAPGSCWWTPAAAMGWSGVGWHGTARHGIA